MSKPLTLTGVCVEPVLVRLDTAAAMVGGAEILRRLEERGNIKPVLRQKRCTLYLVSDLRRLAIMARPDLDQLLAS